MLTTYYSKLHHCMLERTPIGLIRCCFAISRLSSYSVGHDLLSAINANLSSRWERGAAP